MPAPKSAVSALWFVRVDGEIEVLRPKVLSFASTLDVVSMLCVHHTGQKKENPHVHFVVSMNTSVQKQSFALRVKKVFEVVDRGYAVDVWDGNRGEGAVSYLFHESDAPILVRKAWNDDEVKEAQRIGQLIAVAVSTAKDKASQKLVERAVKHFEGRVPTKYDILSHMVDAIYKREAYHPGMFKLKSFIEEVEIKLTPVDQLERLKNSMYTDMFRNG